MTSAGIYKIIELIMLFGAVVGFCVWQLRTVTKLQREQSEDQQQKSDEPARHLER
jgi:hypothetical protein